MASSSAIRGRSLVSSSLTSSHPRLVCPRPHRFSPLLSSLLSTAHGVAEWFAGLQLEALHCLSDVPLICLNCDAFAIPFNDTIEHFCALLEVPPSTFFLISYFLDIILMRNSTAVRCPPIVMSSPCTVATTSSPLMRPLHTHGQALPLVNPRPLGVDASSSSQFCAASRVPYRLYRSSPHVCSPPSWSSSGGNLTNTFLRAGALKYALRTSTNASTLPSRSPVAISNRTSFSASNGGVDANSVSLVFLRDPPRAHSRLPYLSLFGLRPSCLDGCPSSLTQASFPGDPCVHLASTDVLYLFTSCLGTQLRVKPPAFLVVPVPSHALSSSCSS